MELYLQQLEKIYSYDNTGKPWIDMGLLNTGVPYGMATMGNIVVQWE